MKTYLFYTLEGNCESPGKKYVENMQILGEARGNIFSEAYDNLLKENQWIIESCFDVKSILAKQILDDELKNNIQKIINYLWNDEKRHFEEDPCDNHIFLALENLKHSIL